MNMIFKRLKKKSILLSGWLLLVLPGMALGQVLTWEDCVRLTKENNLDLKIAGTQLNQARADLTIAYSDWYPDINLTASVDKSTDFDSSESTGVSTGLSFRQTLFDGFKTPSTVGRAQAQWELAQNQYKETTAALRYELRDAFVGLLKSDALSKLTEVIAKRRKQNVSLVKLRYEAGREHEGSLLAAEADLAQAEFEVEQAHRNNTYERRKLAKLVGSPEEAVQIGGQFILQQPLEDSPDLASLAEDTPSVRKKRLTVDYSRWSVKSAYAALYPTVSFSASAGLSDDHWVPENKRASVGVSLSLPLFAGGSHMAGISKSELALEQAENDLENTRENIKLDLEQSWKNLLDADGQLKVQEKYLLAARTRAKISNAQYSNGLITFDDWSIIEDRLVSTQKSTLNSQAELLLREAQWEETKGEGFDHE